jgi:hypothetical protein
MQPQEQLSLYDRLGGVYNIATVSDCRLSHPGKARGGLLTEAIPR